MRKFTTLVKYLLEASGLPREQCSAFADQGDLLLTGRDMGPVYLPDAAGLSAPRRQLEIGVWKYEAVINLERYPYDGPTLLSLVLAWLAQHDAERAAQGLEDPKVTVTLNEADTADVEIDIYFEEPLAVVEDAAGPIAFEGLRWSLAPTVITPAEALAGLRGAVSQAGHGGAA